jgi:hypothetical protein
MVKFFAKYPTFGTKNNRKTSSYQQMSPYYWWWEYLRRNKDYLECCESEGKGKLSELYKDFGDVRGDSFREWWRVKAVPLFAEKQSDIRVGEIQSKDEIPNEWNKEDLMILKISLGMDKKSIIKIFNQILKKRHSTERGRPVQKFGKSTAKYPINQNFTIDNLRIGLEVYDLYKSTREGDKKLKLWEIGVAKRLLADSMPEPKDTNGEKLIKRNRMAATVGRYIKQAEGRVENVGKGVFP